jgi:hypothetical protein
MSSKGWKFRGALGLGVLALCLAWLGASPALAESPPGCSVHRESVDIGLLTPIVINGQMAQYSPVEASNNLGRTDGCDIENAVVQFFCPAADGMPDLGSPQILSGPGGDDLPANPPVGTLISYAPPALTCTINVNPGVMFATALVTMGDVFNVPPSNQTLGIWKGNTDQAFGVQKPISVTVATCEDVWGPCGETDQCVERGCDPVTGCYENDNSAQCGSSDACVERGCDPATGCYSNDNSDQCGSSDACVDRGCDPATGCYSNDNSAQCGDSDACVDRGCDPATGCYEDDHSSECGTSETCTLRGCDPETGCYEEDPDPLPAECQPLGCRITAGGIAPDGAVDEGEFANIPKATFGGQVGAPCGCIGCFDELEHVQGSWTHSRKKRKGSFHALDYNSLVCGCDGVFDGELCNPDDRDPGPEPRPAPANMACWSGIGDFNPTNGRRTIRVAFRVEVEDRSEPGGPQGSDPVDVYRIRIWVPGDGEDVWDLADQACCTNADPTGRAPDVDDGDDLINGNIQIHPMIHHSEDGVCPVPRGECYPTN